jgi:hypothetical protein
MFLINSLYTLWLDKNTIIPLWVKNAIASCFYPPEEAEPGTKKYTLTLIRAKD